MVFITPEVFAENEIYTVKQQQKKDNFVVLWIRIKDLSEKLNIKNINDSADKAIKGKFKNKPTEKQIKKYKKHGSYFIKGLCFVYAREDVVIPVIMGGGSPEAIEFRSKLGFTQYDITLKKESSVLKSIMETFEEENMETQYSVLTYRVDLCFHDYKLSIEIYEKGHNDRDENHEKQRLKQIEKKFECKFIRINPDEENFKISKVSNKIFRHIKKSHKKSTEESTKKYLIEDSEKLNKMF